MEPTNVAFDLVPGFLLGGVLGGEDDNEEREGAKRPTQRQRVPTSTIGIEFAASSNPNVMFAP